MRTSSHMFKEGIRRRVLILCNLAITGLDRKSTRLNSSHVAISYAVFCLKKKKILVASPHPPLWDRAPDVMGHTALRSRERRGKRPEFGVGAEREATVEARCSAHTGRRRA